MIGASGGGVSERAGMESRNRWTYEANWLGSQLVTRTRIKC
jgi:hypothetical protein